MLTADNFPEANTLQSPRKREGKTKVYRALGLKRRSEGLAVNSATVLGLASNCWFLRGVSDTNLTPALAAVPRVFREWGRWEMFLPAASLSPRPQTSTEHPRASSPGCRQGAACRAELLGEQIPEQAHSMLLLFPGQALYRQRSAHERQHSNARQVSADRHQEEGICFGGPMASTSQTHQALGKASGGVTPGAPKHPSQPYADSSPSCHSGN